MAGIKEACGVFGIYDLDGGNVVPSIYYGLTSLQHRGQESCGLAVSRTDGERGNVQFLSLIHILKNFFSSVNNCFDWYQTDNDLNLNLW